MVTYQYFLSQVDYTSGPVTFIAEVELSNVTMDRQLNQAGNFSGTLSLISASNRQAAKLILPGHLAIYAFRNGECIWGGIIWSFQYSSTDKSFTITAQSWECIFDHRVLVDDFISDSLFAKQGTEQTNIVDVMYWIAIKLNMGFKSSFVPFPLGGTGDASFPTTNIPGYEYHLYSEIVQDVISAGGHYIIEPLTRTINYEPVIGYPVAPRANQDPAYNYVIGRTFDYPGTIMSYTWSNSGTTTAQRFFLIGAGSGPTSSEPLWHDWEYDTYPTEYANGPYWDMVLTNSNLAADQVAVAAGTIDSLQAWGITKAQSYLPWKQDLPTFVCNPEQAQFDLFNKLQIPINVNICDERTNFESQTYSDSLIGWQLTAEGSNSDEELQFVVGRSLVVGQ